MARQWLRHIFCSSVAVTLLAFAVAGVQAQPSPPPAQVPPTPVPSPNPQFTPELSQFWFSILFPPIQPASTDSGPNPPGTTALRSVRPELLGDLPPLPVVGRLPNGTPVALPSIRSFKVGDAESPQPQDRTFINYNYFDNLYGEINKRFGADVSNIHVSKETLIFEKTFCDENASVEARLPLYSTTAQSSIPGLNGSSSTYGDLSLLGKFVLVVYPEQNMLLSGGLALTVPTGPSSLMESSIGSRVHCVTLQPFLASKWERDRWNVLGFTSLDVPIDGSDATLFYNDLSVQYTLYKNETRGAVLNAIVPLAELHLTTPLNHQGILSGTDPTGTPDMLDVSAAIEVRFLDRIKLVVGMVAPVVGPHLMDLEVISQFKVTY